MIPKDSLLRRLPVVLAPDQRIRLEALIFSGDVLLYSLGSIRAIAARHGSHLGTLEDIDRAALFSHSWTIVDQLHSIRLVLKSFTENRMGPAQRAFYDKYSVAREMRNGMDHLDQNVPNMAKAGGRSEPLFGALSYLLVQPHQVDATNGVITGGTIVSIASGSPADGNRMRMPALNPAGRVVRPPVSQFQLSAFGRTLNLEEAVADFEALLNAMAAKLESEIKEQVAVAAKETGEPVGKLLAPALPSLIIYLGIDFTEPGTIELPPSEQKQTK